MARKSRKETFAVAVVAQAEEQRYKTAVYVRLSSEDERKKESDSVANQLNMLRDYVNRDATLLLKEEYVDVNVSGTKFDRPAFNRMMSDIRVGKINCVVVKDLSRLGRNYLEAGDYLEKIFPFFGVRFIAVTDNYDSLTSNPTEDGLAVPLKNLINEAYAKDISKKICTSKENFFKQGIFLAGKMAYGYKKHPGDPHMILIDEEIREVVVSIFQSFADGVSMTQIARNLNADGILAPYVYWQKKGIIHKRQYNNKWELKQIKRILENPIYTGDVLLGKTQRCYYKGIPLHKRTDGYYVKNHHEAIIDHELFQRVQELLQKKRKDYAASKNKYEDCKNSKEDLLQGLLYCGHCGNQMNLYRRTIKLKNGVGHYSTYVCRRTATYGEADPKKNIKAEELENMVLELIQHHISIYLDAKDMLRVLNHKPKAVEKKSVLEQEFTELRNRQEKVESFIQNLYEDFSDGVFSEKEYLDMKAEYLRELERLSDEIAVIKEEIATYEENYLENSKLMNVVSSYTEADKLTKAMVAAFIKKITCYSKDRFEVEYTFSDEYEKLMDLLEKRGGEMV